MSNDKNEKGDYKNLIQGLGPYLGLGIQLAATVAIMTFIGYWLDGKLNTSPYLLIICSIIGIFAALYNFIKTIASSQK
jgi:F0F1-type ATP synthase assembly protein I